MSVFGIIVGKIVLKQGHITRASDLPQESRRLLQGGHHMQVLLGEAVFLQFATAHGKAVTVKIGKLIGFVGIDGAKREDRFGIYAGASLKDLKQAVAVFGTVPLDTAPCIFVSDRGGEMVSES